MAQQDNPSRGGSANANQAPGQQKKHQVRNPSTGETREITQEQWRNRFSDSSLSGFERVDSDEEAGGSLPS